MSGGAWLSVFAQGVCAGPPRTPLQPAHHRRPTRGRTRGRKGQQVRATSPATTMPTQASKALAPRSRRR